MTQDTPRQPRDLDARLAALSPDIPPPEAMWLKIEAQLAIGEAADKQPATGAADSAAAGRTQPVTGLRSVAARYSAAALYSAAAFYSAAAALFAGVTVAVMLWGSAGVGSPDAFAPVASFELDGVDAGQLMQVRNNLHSSLQLALDELAPETRMVVVTNLARIDAARAEIAVALQDDPRNQLLQQMLLASYTNEITLLNEFTLMAGSAPQRTRL